MRSVLTNFASPLTHLYRYLRPIRQIAGKGGRAGVVLGLLAGILMQMFHPALKSARAEVDAASVQRAIDRGVAYLRKSQNQRGGWQEFGGQSCGLSALCTLALLNCGVPKDDPTITSAMRYLRSFE
ncbi:MAG: hypothetical protein MI861_25445, partial [Pirellulales bacterium]|nr:hypothetical protein [Pirellulales bacterium]